jgi:hypothetical protein
MKRLLLASVVAAAFAMCGPAYAYTLEKDAPAFCAVVTSC